MKDLFTVAILWILIRISWVIEETKKRKRAA